MRIALVPSAYEPSVGGVEVLTARLATNLVKAGHAVEVWTGAIPEAPAAEDRDGIVVRRFPFAAPRLAMLPLVSWPGRALSTLQKLRRAHQQFQPDLIHVQCFGVNGAYATMLSRVTGTPLVVTLQGETVMDDQDIYDHSAFLRTALRLGLRRAARVTGCSQFTLDDAIRRFGLAPAKAEVVFNGVDEDEVTPLAVPVPMARYVAALGRVVDKKGFDLLIDAFAMVSPEEPDLGLVIAGEGAALPALQAQARRLGLEQRVHFPGRLDRAQVAGLLKKAECFVMPSRLEPFGIVALEGWRGSVPVIVTNRGGAPEFVEDGVSGLVTDPFDPGSLASAITALVRDHDLRRRLVENGRKSLPAFSWDHLRQQYEVVYRSVSAGGTR